MESTESSKPQETAQDNSPYNQPLNGPGLAQQTDLYPSIPRSSITDPNSRMPLLTSGFQPPPAPAPEARPSSAATNTARGFRDTIADINASLERCYALQMAQATELVRENASLAHHQDELEWQSRILAGYQPDPLFAPSAELMCSYRRFPRGLRARLELDLEAERYLDDWADRERDIEAFYRRKPKRLFRAKNIEALKRLKVQKARDAARQRDESERVHDRGVEKENEDEEITRGRKREGSRATDHSITNAQSMETADSRFRASNIEALKRLKVQKARDAARQRDESERVHDRGVEKEDSDEETERGRERRGDRAIDHSATNAQSMETTDSRSKARWAQMCTPLPPSPPLPKQMLPRGYLVEGGPVQNRWPTCIF